MLAAAAATTAAAADPFPWFLDIGRQGTKGRETHRACAKIFSVQRRARGRDTFANLKEIDFGTKTVSHWKMDGHGQTGRTEPRIWSPSYFGLFLHLPEVWYRQSLVAGSNV